ncbi:DUF3810 domain-containing protein [uncultured Flavobacterium sp.]|uniref:DUF3810 domain-containing protein n=1 Tax=uncultured Flavobacterium sp. TaxID=165435 RepID=UPI0026332986|nr:DUF3810 domain-containing protein [uncultured Flavobacterium sp.]
MKRKFILPLFLLIQIIVVKTIGLFPDFVENVYSKGFYPKLAFVSRKVFGWLPFSFGDVTYFILILLLFRWIWKHRIGFFKEWKDNLLAILSWVSVFYLFFHLLWGMNYYRIPLHEKLHIEKEYSKEQLEIFIEKMLVKTNALQLKITKNDSVAVVIPYSHDEIYNLALKGYENIPTDLQEFRYEVKSIKSSLFSYPLSYMGFGGYLNPFTNEAQVNYLKPKYTSPLTTCHEMAHQTGIGSESECNFIGFVTAAKNEDLYFQYSAYSFALRYALHNLEMMQEGNSEVYIKKINKGVLKNFEENEIFWKKYQTPINTFFEYFYDNFLKANQQKDGMEGYNKFVGLAIGYGEVDSRSDESQ